MAKDKPEPLDDKTVRSIIGAEIKSATGYIDGTISTNRANALKYYRGEPFGNEVDGRSKVVMSDVQDAVEWTMPSLMKIFLAGHTAVKFQPSGPEDEDQAEQMTDYVNHILFTENDGYNIVYQWFKDALLQKNGIIKCFWDESDESERTQHTGLTEQDLIYILTQPVEGEIRVVSQREYSDEAFDVQPVLDEMGQAQLDERGSPVMMDAPMLYDIELERKFTKKGIVIEPVPPEEFLISRDARSMKDARYKAHRMVRSVSWGVDRGFDRAQLVSLSTTGAQYGLLNTESVTRFQDGNYVKFGDVIDEASREVVYVESYMELDVDGDGHAETVQVYTGGEGHEILTIDGEPAITRIDIDQPFVDITPIRNPHVFFGTSFYDLAGPNQLIRSTLVRQVLDNAYGINNNRVAVSNKVDLDDLLTQRPDGVVRVDTDQPDAAMHIAPMPVQPLGQYIFPILEYFEGMTEKRTGVIRLNQGLDAETLDDTKGGQARLMTNANQRLELIARNFAETGFKTLFKLIARLCTAHQDKPKVVRLRNKWAEVDPRTWNAEFNMTAEVGLGYDSRDAEAFAAERILQKQKEIIQYQGGVEGPFVTQANIHKALQKSTEALGFKAADDYFTDPNSPEMQQLMAQKAQQAAQQQQQGDPAMALAQGQIQNDQAKNQVDAGKAQAKDAFDREKLASDERIKMAEIQSRMTIEREKITASMNETAAKIQADDANAAQKLRLEAEIAKDRIESESFNKQMDRQGREEDREALRADKRIDIQRGEDGGLSGTVSVADGS
jgi:hypothetical protein